MKTRTKPILTELARNLRKHPTEAERKLWEKLRKKRLDGIKFRRQEPIGNYIVDFISFEKNIIIEIDGAYHNSKEQKEYDNYRTDYLKFNDALILRFKNEEVMNNIDDVLLKIKKACVE